MASAPHPLNPAAFEAVRAAGAHIATTAPIIPVSFDRMSQAIPARCFDHGRHTVVVGSLHMWHAELTASTLTAYSAELNAIAIATSSGAIQRAITRASSARRDAQDMDGMPPNTYVIGVIGRYSDGRRPFAGMYVSGTHVNPLLGDAVVSIARGEHGPAIGAVTITNVGVTTVDDVNARIVSALTAQ